MNTHETNTAAKSLIRLPLLAAALSLGASAQTQHPHAAPPAATTQTQHQHAASPYAAQLDSPVRGLKKQDVDDLLNGRGAAYSLMAELNGHPGPAHLLELRAQLHLTPEQVTRIEAVKARMSEAAKRVGKRIVEQERALSDLFRKGAANEAEVARRTQELGVLYAEYRMVHLRGHMEATPLLRAHQVKRYDQLRGYAGH